MRFFCLSMLLAFVCACAAQHSLDSTKKGYRWGKTGLLLKRSFDWVNLPGNGHFTQADRCSNHLHLPADASKYALVFADDFDSLNTNIWQIGQPWGRFHGQQPHQYYGDSEVIVKNGKLSLLNRYSPKVFANGDTNCQIPYATGLINTANSKTFQYGYFAIRCKNPSGPATWPAFWLTGKNNWPPEIDVFEMYGRCKGKSIHRQTMTAHYGKIETSTKTHVMKSVKLPSNTDTAFHIYACLWLPGKIQFYTDGVLVRTMRMNKWMKQFYNEPMYLVVNNAVDHRYLECIDNSKLPVSLEVDWIKVYGPLAGVKP